ncbi:MAG TPA: transcriptional regulator [Stenotrophomonas sp.]|jgi:CRP/FNR family transcriptional regulator|uniref:CRP-like protein Clp n=1 Tax=Stenotrophomonas maltophilia TaxID=40324 RepID=A0A4S2CZZ4_STEMA|nr:MULTISPECIES: helix-turn-helix domain-containing protein [Stenotrophomonas]TGY34181.1 cyclic nucleotide-binding domain-containing protein [Stenotrophomonas maltophilia]HBS63510.1 transcriptional regulator [Stenotrophomonas sp.]
MSSSPSTPNPAAADDGDALRFCSTCAFSDACASQGYDKSALSELHVLVDHVGPFHAGEPVFRAGEPFDAIAAVRAGMVKTTVIDSQGHEQVLGFSLPGEVIGLNAIHDGRYPCDAVALDTVYLCRFSFPRMSLLATRMPGLQARLFSLLSAEIGKVAMLAANHRTDARVAAFLLDLSGRYARRGFSATRFTLMMARTDIANYLRMAPETTTRVLRRLQDDGLIEIRQRDVLLRRPDRLAALVASADAG